MFTKAKPSAAHALLSVPALVGALVESDIYLTQAMAEAPRKPGVFSDTRHVDSRDIHSLNQYIAQPHATACNYTQSPQL